jgi:hypothetical protein
LTRPKLIDPFQIVRMGPLPVNSSAGPAPFAFVRGVSFCGFRYATAASASPAGSYTGW